MLLLIVLFEIKIYFVEYWFCLVGHFLQLFGGLFVYSESLRSFSHAGCYEKEESHVTAKRHRWSSKSVQRCCWIVPKRSQGECQPWCQTDGEVAGWAWPLCGGSIEKQEAEYGIGNDAWQNEKTKKNRPVLLLHVPRCRAAKPIREAWRNGRRTTIPECSGRAA